MSQNTKGDSEHGEQFRNLHSVPPEAVALSFDKTQSFTQMVLLFLASDNGKSEAGVSYGLHVPKGVHRVPGEADRKGGERYEREGGHWAFLRVWDSRKSRTWGKA